MKCEHCSSPFIAPSWCKNCVQQTMRAVNALRKVKENMSDGTRGYAIRVTLYNNDCGADYCGNFDDNDEADKQVFEMSCANKPTCLAELQDEIGECVFDPNDPLGDLKSFIDTGIIRKTNPMAESLANTVKGACIMPKDNSVEQIITERTSVYGTFRDNAQMSQSFKRLAQNGVSYDKLKDVEREALDQCFLKMSRILTGKPHKDNWLDISGYANRAAEWVED